MPQDPVNELDLFGADQNGLCILLGLECCF